MVRRFLRDEAGASAAEYAMLLILFGGVVILGSIALAVSIGGGMGRFANILGPTAAAEIADAADSPKPGGSVGAGSSSAGASGGRATPALAIGKTPPPGCGHGRASERNPNCRP